MTSRESNLFRFDDFELDLGKHRLTRGDEAIRLGKLTFELLRVLIQSAPNAVSHEELIEQVWGPRQLVSPETLSQRVMLLRRALGDHAEEPRYIEAIRGHGYRIIPPVHAAEPGAANHPNKISTHQPGSSTARSNRGRAAVLGAALLALGMMGWVLYLDSSTAPKQPPEIVRFELLPQAGRPIAVRPFARDITISPDGARIAYSSTSGSIIVRALASLEFTELSNLGPEVHSVTFSPDGEQLAFLTGGRLKTASINGGPVKILSDVGQYTDGDIDWTAPGFILAANPRGLIRVALSEDEQAELLLVPDPARGEKAFGSPTLLPDEKTVLFVVEPIRTGEQRRIEAYDLVTGARKAILTGGAHPRYVASGHLVVAIEDELRAFPYDLRKHEIDGDPETLETDVAVNLNGTANVAFADNGTLVYVPQERTDPDRSLVWVSRDGTEEVIPVPSLMYTYPRLSPDGALIALDVRWPESDIWLWDTRRQDLSRLTNNPAENALPTWHPSGHRLAFADGRNGTLDIFSADIRGGSAIELVVGTRRDMPVSFSPDGKFLLYGEDQPLGHWSAIVLDVASGENWPLVGRDVPILNPTFSPNGEWITYESRESGQFEVYVRRFSGPSGQQWKVSLDGGVKPRWSRDGSEIFYITLDSQLMSAEVSEGQTFELGPVTHVFDATPYVGAQVGTGAVPYDLSLDGERFLMTRLTSDDEKNTGDARLVVVLNSLERIKD